MDRKTLNERLTLLEQAKNEARQAMATLSQKYNELHAHLNALEGAYVEVQYWLSQIPMELSEFAEKIGAESVEVIDPQTEEVTHGIGPTDE